MDEQRSNGNTDSHNEGGRRRFLQRITVALGGAIAVIAAIPAFAALIWPVREGDGELWRPVGTPDDFPVGSTVKVTFRDPSPLPWAGFAARSAAWLRRENEAHYVAFSIYCTHTACPVNWHAGSQLFLCPCHGGAFYRDGSVAAGPPRTPLVRHPVRVRAGRVEIQTIGVPVLDD